MGAWGSGIFEDDVACDVRIQFRHAIEDGKSPSAARTAVLKTWKRALKDPDDGPTIWLALAATQLQCKCLEKQVRDKAVAILKSGGDIERWRETGDAKLIRSRKAVLARLGARLAKPLPKSNPARAKPKAKRKRFVESKTNFPRGELFAYQMTSGKYVLLHVVDYSGSRDFGFNPIFAVLDWQRKTLPSSDQIRQIPLKKIHFDHLRPNWPFLIEIFRQKEDELPSERIVRLNIIREPHTLSVNGGYSVTHWEGLEKSLDYSLGWK